MFNSHQGKYSVPPRLTKEGLFAIRMRQFEMVGPRDIAPRAHNIIYDRGSGEALYNAINVRRVSSTDTKTIERYLTGKLKPTYLERGEGVTEFIATEIAETLHPGIRNAIKEFIKEEERREKALIKLYLCLQSIGDVHFPLDGS